MDSDFDNFKGLISPWKETYLCAVNSYVALKTTEGPRILFGRVLLESSLTGINQTPFTFETEHVIAGYFVTTVAEAGFADILAIAKRGEMQGPSALLSLLIQKGQESWTYYAPFYHPLVPEGPRLPTLVIRGISKHELFLKVGNGKQLDWELKAANLPFDTLDDLLSHCGLPTTVQMTDSTTLEIIARSPAMILDTSTISDGAAILECRGSKLLKIENIKFGYKIFNKDLIERGSAIGTTFQWNQDGDFQIGRYQFPVGDASVVQSFLSYSGVSLHQWWVADPKKPLNPRHAIHQIFDQNFEFLEKMLLKPEMDKALNFEGAVNSLLNILGFSTSHYGRIPKFQKGPDIIAVTPFGHIGVIECTLGMLDENDKLAKLVQRTQLIREKLASGYAHLQILPIIVTSLSREEVAGNLDAAGKYDIAVVCRENIEGLLKQAILPPKADNLFQDLKKLIPDSDQEVLFQGQK